MVRIRPFWWYKRRRKPHPSLGWKLLGLNILDNKWAPAGLRFLGQEPPLFKLVDQAGSGRAKKLIEAR